MIALLVYGVVVGLLVVAAARAGESLARNAGRSVRWIWFGGMLATLGLSFVAANRANEASTRLPSELFAKIDVASAPTVLARASMIARVVAAAHDAQRPLNGALAWVTSRAQHIVPPNAIDVAMIAWALLGAALMIVFLGVQGRMRRARVAWPLTEIAGARVRLSPAVGPLVAGVVRPEIVVPRWILERRADEQRMVIAHEAEHVRAHDPALLGVACIALAVMPWNPALWYMFSRLRLAVELDCDARVLRAGSTPSSYGALLIDVAERASLIRLSALALADDSSHLHQRILAMKPERARFALARAGAAAALGLVALLAACAAEMPTASDIQQMDASTAAVSAKKLAIATKADTTIEYIVDGKPMRADEARAISPADIDRVEISKSAISGRGTVLMWTKKPTGAGDIVDPAERRVALRLDGKAGADTVLVKTPATIYLRKQGVMQLDKVPVMYIDGVRVKSTALESIDRERIDRIDVIKGPSAAKLYGPDAAAGAIIIHTKAGGGKP